MQRVQSCVSSGTKALTDLATLSAPLSACADEPLLCAISDRRPTGGSSATDDNPSLCKGHLFRLRAKCDSGPGLNLKLATSH